MAANYYRRDCGHLSEAGGRGPIEPLAGLCHACLQARVGEEIQFLRFGHIPEFSENHRDGVAEEGVSVYEIRAGQADLCGWHFGISDRPVAYRGQGRIVGWGSDGEPLVEVLSSQRIGRKAVGALRCGVSADSSNKFI